MKLHSSLSLIELPVDRVGIEAPWEPLLASLDSPTATLTFVAHWLGARVACRRDQRFMLLDCVYHIAPGSERSSLRNYAPSNLAHGAVALRRNLVEAVKVVAEIGDSYTSRTLVRASGMLASTTPGYDLEQVARWVAVSLDHGVEHRAFLQTYM